MTWTISSSLNKLPNAVLMLMKAVIAAGHNAPQNVLAHSMMSLLRSPYSLGLITTIPVFAGGPLD